MAERVLVAMSGGVDSSVAALLLRDAGHEVVGLFMSFFDGQQARPPGSRSCCAVEDASDARAVADRLGILFYTADLTEDFAAIKANFVSEYRIGRTPVPCTLCNRDLKFGRLLSVADDIGATRVATGHYARITTGDDGVPRLCRARDQVKDQTYFLWPLSGAGLERAWFPLGDLEKDEVRDLAARGGLMTADKPESQDLCFVPDGDYLGWLRREGKVEPRRGLIVDEDGNEIGEHQGIEAFTIGQRRGLEVALGEPRYVVALRPESNQVVIGRRDALAVKGLVAEGASWLGASAPMESRTAEVKVRHARHGHTGIVTPLSATSFRVDFEEPVFGVAPGQAAVCYVEDVVLAGGWISSADPARSHR